VEFFTALCRTSFEGGQRNCAVPRNPRKNQWNRAAKKCEGRCWYCGILPPEGELTVDHAKPRSRGGANWDDNLLPACVYCNNLKGSRTLSEFRKLVKALVIRNFIGLGYLIKVSQVRIVFYGEGNSHPFSY